MSRKETKIQFNFGFNKSNFFKKLRIHKMVFLQFITKINLKGIPENGRIKLSLKKYIELLKLHNVKNKSYAGLLVLTLIGQILSPAFSFANNPKIPTSLVAAKYISKSNSIVSTNETSPEFFWNQPRQSLSSDLPSSALAEDFSKDNSTQLFYKPENQTGEASTPENSISTTTDPSPQPSTPEPTAIPESSTAAPESTIPESLTPPVSIFPETVEPSSSISAFVDEIVPADLPPTDSPTLTQEPKLSEPVVETSPPVEPLQTEPVIDDSSITSSATPSEPVPATEVQSNPAQPSSADESTNTESPIATEPLSTKETVIPGSGIASSPYLEFSTFEYSGSASGTLPSLDYLTKFDIKLSLSALPQKGVSLVLEYQDRQGNWQIAQAIDLSEGFSNALNQDYLTVSLPLDTMKRLSGQSVRLSYQLLRDKQGDLFSNLPLFSVDSLWLEAEFSVPTKQEEEDLTAEELAALEQQLLNPEPFTKLDLSNQSFDLSMPGDLSDPVTLGQAKKTTTPKLSVLLVGASASTTAVREGNLITYNDALINTDVTYETQETKLKESIILKDKENYPSRFRYMLNLSDYDYLQTFPNFIQLYKKGHKGEDLYQLYSITAPIMTDVEGKTSNQLVLKLKNNLLTLTPDARFLKSASFPVTIDPTVEISVINVHSHPVAGESWNVNFTTVGQDDLYITPADQATIDDMQFISLYCGSEDRTSGVQILSGDVIYYPNWQCDDIATVSHLDLKTDDHHFIFTFGGATADAYNSAYKWDGGGVDSNWTTKENWSSDIVPLSTDTVTFDNLCVTNCNVTINTSTTVSSFTISSNFIGNFTQPNGYNLTISGAYLQATSTFTGGNGTIKFQNNVTISGGTYNAASTTIFNLAHNQTIDVNTTQDFYDVQFDNGNVAWTTIISPSDTLVVNGTLNLTTGMINTGTINAKGNIVQGPNSRGGNTVIDFGNDSVAQTYTANGGIGPNIRFDSAADANDSVVITAVTTFYGVIITSSFSGIIPFSNPSGYNLTISGALDVDGGWQQAAGTFNGGPWTFILKNRFIISGGTYNAASTTIFNQGSNTIDVNVTQNFNDVQFNSIGSNFTTTISPGDTLVINGTLTLSMGRLITGTIKAKGNIIQDSTFGSNNSGTYTILDFDNDSVAQTYTINGGIGPNLRLDSAADANDSIIFNAAGGLVGLNITSGFSGTVPIFNPSNYMVTVGANGYSQAAGTFQGGPYTFKVSSGDFTISGGTYNAASTTIFNLYHNQTIDVNTTQDFYNLQIDSTNSAFTTNIGSGDTLVANGTTSLTTGKLNIGTIKAQGDVVVTSNFTGGSTVLIFSGSTSSGLANQTFNLTGATGLFDSDITINKTEGSVSLLSALLMDAANQDLTIATGTLDLNGNNLTVNGTSGTLVVGAAGNLQMQGGETITKNANNPQLNSSSTVTYDGSGSYTIKDYTYGGLVISGTGTFAASTTQTALGNFIQTAGTFTAPSGNFNVGGNFAHTGGVFTHNSGTVVLNGVNQSVLGTTTFNNFTKSTSTTSTLTFASSTTQTILGTLTLQGASPNLLSLRSDSTGTQWRIDPQGARTLAYLDVKDSNNINASTIVAINTNSVDSGNNLKWSFITPAYTQTDYRFYENINNLQPSTALGLQNTAVTIYNTTTPVRLRMNVAVGANELPANFQQFKLQVSTATTTGWISVNTSLGAGSSWWNDSWQNRRKITFNNASSTENLTNFPVLVSLNATSTGNIDYSKTKAAGADIRFVDPDGTALNYEIEKWDTFATSTVWVKVPQIDQASTTDFIWMYYNNTNATDNSTTTGVWNSSYIMVQHLGEVLTGSGQATRDSTTNSNNGSSVGTWGSGQQVFGQIDGSLNFNGSNDAVSINNASSLNPTTAITIEAWIKPADTTAEYDTVVTKRWATDVSPWTTYALNRIANSQTYNFCITNTSSTAFCAVSISSAPLNQWTHLVGTYDGSLLRMYFNGNLNATSSATGLIQSNTKPVYIGANSYNREYFNGPIDEVRISSTTRSTSWIGAEYKTMVETYNTYATEETIGSNSWTFYDNASVASGTAISATLLSTSNVQGTYMESNPTALNPFSATVGQLVEYDFALSVASIATGTPYYFRLIKSDGTALDSYSSYPTLTLTPDQTPNVPANLGPGNLIDASWGTNNTPTLTFDLNDPDGGDQVKYHIQISTTSNYSSLAVDYTSTLSATGTKSFTVGQVEGSGTYAVGSAGQSLPDNTGYYWRVLTTDDKGASSAYTTANSGSIAFKVDTTAPNPGAVSIDATSATSLTPSVSGASDAASDLSATPYTFYNTTNDTISSATTSTSWLSSGLSINTQYTYIVTVTDTAGNIATSSSASLFTRANPPANLATTSVSRTGIDLAWSANSNPNGTEYLAEIVASSTNSGWITATSTSFILTCGTEYSFRVKARNHDNVNTAYSSTLTATTLSCNTAPNIPNTLAPANLVNGSWGTDNTPTLTFYLSDPDAGDAVKYRIQISTTSNYSTLAVDYTSAFDAQGDRVFTVGQAESGGTYTVGAESQTLPDASAYYWQVLTTDDKADSSTYTKARSGSVAFKVDALAPIAGVLSLTTNTPTSLIVSISGVSDSGSGLASSPFIFYNQTTSANSSATSSDSWTSENLIPNTEYIFYAEARDIAGNISSTSVSSLYTLANIPSGLSASADSDAQITVSWNSNSNSDGTEYYAANTTSGTNSGWTTSRSYSFANLTCGNSYSFKVKARNHDNLESSYSSTATKDTGSCGGLVSSGGGGGGSSLPNPLPPSLPPLPEIPTTPYYFVCRNNACVNVEGSGFSTCENNLDCQPLPPLLSHNICRNNACVIAEGLGEDECITNINCVPEVIIPPPITPPVAAIPPPAEPESPIVQLPDLSGIAEDIGNTTNNVLDSVGGAAKNLSNAISNTVSGVAGVVGSTAQSFGSAIGNAAGGIGNNLADVAGNLSGSFGTLVYDIGRGTANTAILAAETAKTGFAASKKVVQGLSTGQASTQVAAGVVTAAVAPSVLAMDYSIAAHGLLFNLATLPDLWLKFLSLIYGLLTSLGLRRKRQYWGTVYDSTSKQPLDPVMMELVDAKTNKVVDQSITDMLGRFGFLIKPGSYFIRAKKTHYRFPSTSIQGKVDGLFNNLYYGEKLAIQSQIELLAPNIPMDPLAFDWNQEDKKRIIKFNPKLELAINITLRILFWGGALFVLLMALGNPSILNLSMLGLYLILSALRKLIPSKKLWGKLVSATTPVEGLLLELSPKKVPNVIVGHSLTTEGGKFFLKAHPGEYVLKVKKIKGTGLETIYTKEVIVKNDGVVNGKFVI